MLTLVGTIPDKSIPIIFGQIAASGDKITLENHQIPVNRGTPAMVAAAAETLKYLGQPSPLAYLVGDIGDGDGSRNLYKLLAQDIGKIAPKTLTMHYFQPDIKLFKQMLSAIKALPIAPKLIADAGFMYVAKMGGDSSSFDLFTPDAGELAYLADEKAPHPFYTRGFILHDENQVPQLIERAYNHNNASNFLLVKGAVDFIASKNGILATIDSPQIEALEAIGGTGDTLTGIVSAMIQSGMDLKSACINAARVNRMAGLLAQPSPATQVYDIIKQIPYALEKIFEDSQG